MGETKKMKQRFRKGRNYWTIFLLFGILCSMINCFSFQSSASSAFCKRVPNGVMATAVGRKVVITWELVTGATKYQIFEAVGEGSFSLKKETEKEKCILTGRKKGKEYRYYVRAVKEKNNQKIIYGKASKEVSTTVPANGTSTIKNFLNVAIAPVGSTMYVWGGGWNKADTGAGTDARRTGLSSAWRTFAKGKKASYNYQNYRYQIHNGLDCSGYVGWCVYNVLNTKNNQKGYVYSASNQAEKLSALGFGSYRSQVEKDYQPGDIMSSTCSCCGHVWIVLGECSDGSVVLLHSSPAGVQISGTVTPEGKSNSKAIKLAKKYMKKYYPAWYKKYPNVERGLSYLSHYGQMRWKTTGDNVVLSDPDGYSKMSAEEVLKDLFK